ncbi:MAG: sugar transferase [Candidatus Korobacteraceae bacterium]
MNTAQIGNLGTGTGLSAAFTPPTDLGLGSIETAGLVSSLTGISLPPAPKFGPAKWYDLGKRLFDLMVSASLLLLSAPFFAGIAAVVKATSSGPAFFRQERVGQAGQRFAIYKFRSMYGNAPKYEYSPKSSDDPRITSIGRFLRRTHLDEWPQLINVLLGQMSLVGPRPEMPFIVEQYTPEQRQRLAVKPGITGLWQISAHRSFPIHEHLEYDFYYLRHRSPLLDATILVHTFFSAPRGV